MASVLFIMMKSPHENVNLELVDDLGKDVHKAALLFEDAVYYAVDKKHCKHLADHVDEVYVMKDDLAARGFQGKSHEKYKEVDYGMAVDLIMERFDRTITI